MFFFFNDTATTEIYTLSLHDALPISPLDLEQSCCAQTTPKNEACKHLLFVRNCIQNTVIRSLLRRRRSRDRKSTRLNSSHANISYAVFCLKKKKHILIIFTMISISLI